MASLSIHTNLMAMNTGRTLQGHYSRLSDSVQRLSSGLRVNTAADDAAGLAIRELMRADVSALNQGMRNANDAISMLQTADGALGVIDEKLIRMKELAEQAATGTYDSTQRLMIDSEFQAMGAEIDRIAKSTDFNGIKLLDGSRSGAHDGSGLNSTGALKVHFGTGNDSAEDYYYVDIGDATLAGLGLRDEGVGGGGGGGGGFGGVPILSDRVTQGVDQGFTSGLISFAVVPAGTTGLDLLMNDRGFNDDIQIFTRSGQHLAGTTFGRWISPPPPPPASFLTEANGFLPGATYSDADLNGIGGELVFNGGLHNFTANGMNISYTGDGGSVTIPRDPLERLLIPDVTEDIVVMVVGGGGFNITADWTAMGAGGGGGGGVAPGAAATGPVMSIKTQDLAQKGLERLDNAIVTKDKIRANLGAVQNRLENTVSNLSIQAENLQAAESRISDTDVATEMTAFTRSQILTQSATAMLAQANSLPKTLARLLEG